LEKNKEAINGAQEYFNQPSLFEETEYIVKGINELTAPKI